jgi:hypothetical protein
LIAPVLLAVFAAPPDGLAARIATSTCTQAEIDAVIAGRGPLPSLARVQDAARAVALARADDEAWSERARWRGLIPRIDVSVGTNTDLAVRDTVDARTVAEARALGLRVAARFELGDLVFSDAELRGAHQRAAREDAADDRVLRVTALYFDRVAVVIALRARPSVELSLKARLLDGQLTALTGGLIPLPSGDADAAQP